MQLKLIDRIPANDEFFQRTQEKVRNLFEPVHFKMQPFEALQLVDGLVEVLELVAV